MPDLWFDRVHRLARNTFTTACFACGGWLLYCDDPLAR